MIKQSNGTGDGVQSNNSHNIIQDFDNNNEKQSLDLELSNNNSLHQIKNPTDPFADNGFNNQIKR